MPKPTSHFRSMKALKTARYLGPLSMSNTSLHNSSAISPMMKKSTKSYDVQPSPRTQRCSISCALNQSEVFNTPTDFDLMIVDSDSEDNGKLAAIGMKESNKKLRSVIRQQQEANDKLERQVLDMQQQVRDANDRMAAQKKECDKQITDVLATTAEKPALNIFEQ